jgi:hypothetical protein
MQAYAFPSMVRGVDTVMCGQSKCGKTVTLSPVTLCVCFNVSCFQIAFLLATLTRMLKEVKNEAMEAQTGSSSGWLHTLVVTASGGQAERVNAQAECLVEASPGIGVRVAAREASTSIARQLLADEITGRIFSGVI